MASNISFKQKVDELQEQLNKASKSVSSKDKCIPGTFIIGAIAPIIIGTTLYFTQPSFVQKKEGTKYVKNNSKVICWTMVVTILIWISLYLFSYFKGSENLGQYCPT